MTNVGKGLCTFPTSLLESSKRGELWEMLLGQLPILSDTSGDSRQFTDSFWASAFAFVKQESKCDMWFPHQQQRRCLETWVPPRPMNQKPWGWSPVIGVWVNPLGSSDAHSSLRTTTFKVSGKTKQDHYFRHLTQRVFITCSLGVSHLRPKQTDGVHFLECWLGMRSSENIQ